MGRQIPVALLLCHVIHTHLIQFSTAGYVRITEPLRDEVVQEGQRAKFVCKIEVNDYDLPRLNVTWRVNGRFLIPDTYYRNNPVAAGKEVYYRDGSSGRAVKGFVDLKSDLEDIEDEDYGSPIGDRGRYMFKQDKGRHTLIVRKTRMSDAGVYTCVASVGRETDRRTGHLKIRSAPDAPVDVKVDSCHGNAAVLSWIPGEENGKPILGFVVQFNTSDWPEKWFDFEESFDSKARMVSLQLYPGLTYSFRVKARNELGSSKPSIPTGRKCTTPPDRPDRNPRNVRTNTGVKNTLVIEWTPMSRLHFHGPRFRYHVHWRRQRAFKWNEAYVNDPAQGFLDVETNDVYELYELQVKAENSMGEALQPAYIYLGRSGENEPLAIPGNFSLNPDIAVEPHLAHFVWDAVDTDPRVISGKFKGYKLRYWIASEGWPNKKEVEIIMGGDNEADKNNAPLRVQVVLSDLPAYTSLQAQVAVINTHHTGPFSKILEFATPEGVPSPVGDIRLEGVGVAYVLLKWRPPERPNGVIQGYDIAYQQVTGSILGEIRPLTPHINDPTTLGARITGLRSAHRYRFIVWARNRKGLSEPTYVDVETAKGKPPHPPKLKVAELGKTGVNVTWMADQASPDLKFQVEYRESGNKNWQNTEYVTDKSWVMLDGMRVPVSDLEVRLIASNRLGDTATSRTIAVAKSESSGQTVVANHIDLHNSLARKTGSRSSGEGKTGGINLITSGKDGASKSIASPRLNHWLLMLALLIIAINRNVFHI